MADTDAPQVEPLTLTLEEMLLAARDKGYMLLPTRTMETRELRWSLHKESVIGSRREVDYLAGFASPEEAAAWLLGVPVVPRDDTAYWRLSAHVENALAPVLGYEYDEAVGWNVGEHTAESLVMAAASRTAELVEFLERIGAFDENLEAANSPELLPCFNQRLYDEWKQLSIAARAVLARVKGGER